LSETLQQLLDWVGNNPTTAYGLVMLVALGESLLVVGLLVPGAALMLLFGALIAAGALDFWITYWAAVAGAIVGDGISYWIGRHYKDGLRGMWPFRSHPRWLARGESFFRAHGGKSVVFGRFFGPVRAFVPAVAGMMGMRAPHFLAVNAGSALAWAPAYLLPGMAVGASLALASRVAGRLGVLVVLLLGLIYVVFWAFLKGYHGLQPHLENLVQRSLDWASRHPRLGPPVASLIDPRRREAIGLLAAAGSLLIAATLLLLAGELLDPLLPPGPDAAFEHLLEELRTPWSDGLMAHLAAAAGRSALLIITVTVALWLAWRRHWLSLLHWLGAATFGLLLSLVLARFGADETAALATTLFLFLSAMVARQLPPWARPLPYAGAAVLVILTATARIYLGSNHLTITLVGITLGGLWAGLLALAYRRHCRERVGPAGVLILGCLALLTVSLRQPAGIAAPEFEHRVATLPASAWDCPLLASLPDHRAEAAGETDERFNVYWAAPLAEILWQLQSGGWDLPVEADLSGLLAFLIPETAADRLPVLPRLHYRQLPALTRVLGGGSDNERTVLRLWRIGVVLDDGRPVWAGTANREQTHRLASLVAVLEQVAPPSGSGLHLPLPGTLSLYCDGQEALMIGPAPEAEG
jgi:undecaprenyl-diphosphatase